MYSVGCTCIGIPEMLVSMVGNTCTDTSIHTMTASTVLSTIIFRLFRAALPIPPTRLRKLR